MRWWPQPGVVPVAMVLGAGLLAMSRGAQSGEDVRRSPDLLAARSGRPVTVGEIFGAWPRNGQAGGCLLEAVVARLQADRVGLIVHAADDRLADWYRRQGGRVADRRHPRIIAWMYPRGSEAPGRS